MNESRMRKTKIVATIGPACDNHDTLRAMIRAGMNVARLNLSFGTDKDQADRVERIRTAAAAENAHVAIMADTKGIEIRTGMLEEGMTELTAGSEFTLYGESRLGNSAGVEVTYHGLWKEVQQGTPILLDDGAMELEVVRVEEPNIHTRVVHGGLLRQRKGVNLPETQLSLSAVNPVNREEVISEMRFAAEHDIEYVAASFIQTAEDLNNMREILAEYGADIPIIAKIENRAGVRNLAEIVEAANGIMVARGDLGVELPLADVPSMQKRIIRMTVNAGKPVITATQMLASMENNPKPTRAEASDVANAILDGTSSVMLSGESAMGRYPVLAVRTMATLAERAEAYLNEYGYLQKIQPHAAHVITEAVSQAAITMADHLNAAAILCLTETGFTSRQISKHRPQSPIFAVTASPKVARTLALNWSVQPLLYEGELSDEAKLHFACEQTRLQGHVKQGDVVIVTAGMRQAAGGTDLIRVVTVE